MIQRVLSIDPGKMTGVNVTWMDDQTVSLITSDECPPDKLIPWLRHHIDGWEAYDGNPPLRIVVEKFIINTETGKKSQEASWALRMTGAVEQVLRDVGYPESAVVWQLPAEAKNAFSNESLKRLGIWHRGGAGHALDSIRHSLLYLVKSGWSGKNDTVI